jgi:hypothetical protein
MYIRIILVTKITISLDVKPRSSLQVHGHFRGIYSLHLQGRRVRYASSQLRYILRNVPELLQA